MPETDDYLKQSGLTVWNKKIGVVEVRYVRKFLELTCLYVM